MTDAQTQLFDLLPLPDSEIARAAYAFTEYVTADFVFNHSVRSYVFATAQAKHRGLQANTDYDDELVFLSCLLHDIGLSEVGNGDQRFEVDGADTAADFLRGHGVDDTRIATVWDAIALHTSQGIASRKSLEVALTQAGIATDILGIDRENLPPGLADQMHALLPRADLGYALSAAVLNQVKAKPHKAFPTTLSGELMRLHSPHGGFPGWYDLIDAAGWGDKPVGASPRRAETPQQAAELYMEYLAAGDLDALMSLYEPHAYFASGPESQHVGAPAIRDALRQLIDSGATLKLELREIRQADDIAMVSNTATLTTSAPESEPVIATSTEILRRQPDGGWRYLIDDPFFG
jgi:ketosteroid isomerase-like protein